MKPPVNEETGDILDFPHANTSGEMKKELKIITMVADVLTVVIPVILAGVGYGCWKFYDYYFQ